jgi:hypothetical protein
MDAVIIFKDGSSKRCSTVQATAIRQVLWGEKRPKSKAHDQFCLTVKDVVFDQVQLIPLPFEDNVKDPRTGDRNINRILRDPNLKGIERARAVAKRLNRRVQKRQQTALA